MLFSPVTWQMIQFDEHLGWNHQLVSHFAKLFRFQGFGYIGDVLGSKIYLHSLLNLMHHPCFLNSEIEGDLKDMFFQSGIYLEGHA